MLESYITHVRIIEDAHYPSSRPPPDASSASKKNRAIIISVRKSGRVRVHKARENPNGTFQIGKTWNLDELSQIENDTAVPTGFIMFLGKPYYWNTNSPREKTVFMNSTIRIYKKYTGGKTPTLIGFENIVSSPVTTSPTTFPNSPSLQNTGAQNGQETHMQAPPVPKTPPQPVRSARRPSIGNASQRGPPQHRQAAPIPPQQSSNHAQGPLVIPTVISASGSKPEDSISKMTSPLPLASGLVTSKPIVPVVAATATAAVATTAAIKKEQHAAPVPEISQTRPQTPPQAEIPTIILNNDPTQRPVSFASPNRKSLDNKTRNNSDLGPLEVLAPAIHVNDTEIPEETNEESLKDLADGVIYDTTPKRSSIQGIKIFARKADEHREQPKPKPTVHGIKFEVHREDGTSTPISDDDESDNEDEDDYNDRGSRNEDEDANEDSDGKDEASEKGSISTSRGLTFMAPRIASIVEETLEELSWSGRTDAKTLELSISNEIAGLEAQNLHNVVDLDDKLDDLDSSLSSAIKECEKLDTVLAFFSVQLGSFGDEIAHIEGQGEGLQVQTRNQKVLWTELNNILHTVSLPSEALAALRTHGFSKVSDIETIENVLINLYNAVKAVKSSGNDGSGEFLGSMRALKEKKHIYEQAAAEFMSKYKVYLDSQVASAVSEVENKIVQPQQNSEPKLNTLESTIFHNLYSTSAITLFVKEIDDLSFFSLLRGYQQKIKPYYDETSSTYFLKWKRTIGQLDPAEDLFGSKEVTEVSISSQVKTSLKRSGTLAKFKSHTAEFKDKTERHGSTAGISSFNSAASDNAYIAKISKPSPVCGYLVRVLEVIKSLVVCQQEVLVFIFHLSSYGASKYPEFVKASPVSHRLGASAQLYERIFDIDSDRGKAQELLQAMNEIFSPLQDHMVKFFSEVLEQSSVNCPGLLTSIDVLRRSLEVSNQDYLNQLLSRLHDRVIAIWNQFISKQIAHIASTMISSKKRTGPVFFIKVFPVFCKKIEQDIKRDLPAAVNVNELAVRAVVDKSYDQVGKTMIHTLQRTAKESPSMAQQRQANAGVRNGGTNATNDTINDYEDKEVLNYHIFMIENMTLMSEGLEPLERNNNVLHNLYQLSQSTLRNETDLYVEFLMHRPVGKFRSFVDEVELIYKKYPNDNPATKPGLSRSALKKLLLNYDVKELRKGLENLRKRIEKHFSDMEEVGAGANNSAGATNTTGAGSAGGVMPANSAFQKRLVAKIWKFVEAQYSTLFNKLRMICERHYSSPGESGYVCAVEFTEAEMASAFKVYT